MSTPFDRFVSRIPGSTSIKALGAALIITIGAGIPFFSGKGDKRQGHHIFSSDKPEAVITHQEQVRKEYMRSQEEIRRSLTKTES